MKSLTCVVIGDGSVVVVEIDERKKVATLKKMIKEEKMYKLPADQLTLYVAKKGGNWLKSDDPGVLQLKEGVVATAIRDIMKNEMNPTYRVHNKAFGFPDEDKVEDEDAADGEIHVLVGLPEYVKKGPRYDQQEKPERWHSAMASPVSYSWNWLSGIFSSAESVSSSKKDV
ncbi:hypothetical protein PF006_g30065 [Phytophthora fragariae]|uniref:Crinkler effector protein N-terminal domain-containing protein n=1 Tax=Phytophthora fragariae TaxID=53985 RepID=A0A6A3Q1U1_9STRA|nr:hypothetical protein PF006_g30065 [Phytophthora fragariae]